MEFHAYLIINVTLIISCFIMSLFFLFLPLPQAEGLRNYCVSLRFLALAYLSLSVLTVIDLLAGRNILSCPLNLIAISLQTIFFAFSLINLINRKFVHIGIVSMYIAPTVIFIVLFIFFAQQWGNPDFPGQANSIRNCNHPTLLLNMTFLLFCIIQLIYLSVIFILEARKYKLKLDNYFADTYQLKLRWVQYLFYGAVAFCLLVLVSLFLASVIFALIVTLLNALFYIAFGLYYIQYPRTYSTIAPIFDTTSAVYGNEADTSRRTLSWQKLRCTIIADKYYLCPDINIEDMAQYLKIGRSTLSGYINREENMSFHAWINRLRIDEAKRLIITHPDYSIAQISDTIGFSEPSNFSRQFKNITHHSPLEWKQKQRRSNKE